MRIPLILCAVGALAVGGCGSDDPETAGVPETPPNSAQGEISEPQRDLLQDAQEAAAGLAVTTRGYANGSISREDAAADLERIAQRAAQISEEAAQLPATDATAQDLSQFAESLEVAAERLLQETESEERPDMADLQEPLADVEARSSQFLERYGEQLSEEARAQAREAVDAFDELLG